MILVARIELDGNEKKQNKPIKIAKYENTQSLEIFGF